MSMTRHYDKPLFVRKGVLPYRDSIGPKAEYAVFSISDSPDTAVFYPEPPPPRSFRTPEPPFESWPVSGFIAKKLRSPVQNLETNPDALMICSFRIPDWNSGLTPWPAPSPFGGPEFAGMAGETREFLEQRLIPEAEGRNSTVRKRYLAGYSLGGLFAIWFLMESSVFSGAAAISPSLWYPGFRDCILPRAGNLTGDIYLSLGTGECRSASMILNSCSTNCAAFFRAARNRPGFRTVFERTPGGHFNHPEERLYRGISFLLATGSSRNHS
ncbi:alpha/beta hydrolase-fold protein [Succinimonas amylolytica]|uniref:alpha/beta hydrolase-fold protein n=1 Tax=Succinimonas amylolytica TaxID=83769 RepID=UPI00037E1D9A|nr:alpha/beta hydrolase-fold protein [Succinimonas amylolytica]